MKKNILVFGLVLALLVLTTATSVIACGDNGGQDGDNGGECIPHDIPEFTTVGAGIALLGAAGYAVYRRFKK